MVKPIGTSSSLPPEKKIMKGNSPSGDEFTGLEVSLILAKEDPKLRVHSSLENLEGLMPEVCPS